MGHFATRIRPLIAVLALLLSAILARADKPIVIKDSEAIQYVGKEVEVRGCVVSVTTSPFGTAFINFGGEYPNQTFAGFISAGSPNSDRPAAHHDPGENHRHHGHNPTSRREARDRDCVAKSDQRVGFSAG